MRRQGIFLFFIFSLVINLSAQEAPFGWDGTYYQIYSTESNESAENLGIALEGLIEKIDRYLTLPPKEKDFFLSVYDFKNQDEFINHLSKSQLGTTLPSPLYLHFDTPKYRRLVGINLQESWIPTQQKASVQILRAYFGEVPLWLQEGYSLFFSDPLFKETPPAIGDATWLKSVKQLIPKMTKETIFLILSNNDSLKASTKEARLLSWAWVSYLYHNPDVSKQRLLWNIWNLVLSNQDRQTNTQEVYHRIFENNGNMEFWVNEFIDFYRNTQTYHQALSNLKNSINTNDLLTARSNLDDLQNNYSNEDYRVSYYAGLLAYKSKEWEKAIDYYMKAINLQSPKGLSEYGIILCYLNLGQKEDARRLWELIRVEAAEAYKSSLENLSPYFR